MSIWLDVGKRVGEFDRKTDVRVFSCNPENEGVYDCRQVDLPKGWRMEKISNTLFEFKDGDKSIGMMVFNNGSSNPLSFLDWAKASKETALKWQNIILQEQENAIAGLGRRIGIGSSKSADSEPKAKEPLNGRSQTALVTRRYPPTLRSSARDVFYDKDGRIIKVESVGGDGSALVYDPKEGVYLKWPDFLDTEGNAIRYMLDEKGEAAVITGVPLDVVSAGKRTYDELINFAPKIPLPKYVDSAPMQYHFPSVPYLSDDEAIALVERFDEQSHAYFPETRGFEHFLGGVETRMHSIYLGTDDKEQKVYDLYLRSEDGSMKYVGRQKMKDTPNPVEFTSKEGSRWWFEYPKIEDGLKHMKKVFYWNPQGVLVEYDNEKNMASLYNANLQSSIDNIVGSNPELRRPSNLRFLYDDMQESKNLHEMTLNGHRYRLTAMKGAATFPIQNLKGKVIGSAEIDMSLFPDNPADTRDITRIIKSQEIGKFTWKKIDKKRYRVSRIKEFWSEIEYDELFRPVRVVSYHEPGDIVADIVRDGPDAETYHYVDKTGGNTPYKLWLHDNGVEYLSVKKDEVGEIIEFYLLNYDGQPLWKWDQASRKLVKKDVLDSGNSDYMALNEEIELTRAPSEEYLVKIARRLTAGKSAAFSDFIKSASNNSGAKAVTNFKKETSFKKNIIIALLGFLTMELSCFMFTPGLFRLKMRGFRLFLSRLFAGQQGVKVRHTQTEEDITYDVYKVIFPNDAPQQRYYKIIKMQNEFDLNIKKNKIYMSRRYFEYLKRSRALKQEIKRILELEVSGISGDKTKEFRFNKARLKQIESMKSKIGDERVKQFVEDCTIDALKSSDDVWETKKEKANEFTKIWNRTNQILQSVENCKDEKEKYFSRKNVLLNAFNVGGWEEIEKTLKSNEIEENIDPAVVGEANTGESSLESMYLEIERLSLSGLYELNINLKSKRIAQELADEDLSKKAIEKEFGHIIYGMLVLGREELDINSEIRNKIKEHKEFLKNFGELHDMDEKSVNYVKGAAQVSKVVVYNPLFKLPDILKDYKRDLQRKKYLRMIGSSYCWTCCKGELQQCIGLSDQNINAILSFYDENTKPKEHEQIMRFGDTIYIHRGLFDRINNEPWLLPKINEYLDLISEFLKQESGEPADNLENAHKRAVAVLSDIFKDPFDGLSVFEKQLILNESERKFSMDSEADKRGEWILLEIEKVKRWKAKLSKCAKSKSKFAKGLAKSIGLGEEDVKILKDDAVYGSQMMFVYKGKLYITKEYIDFLSNNPEKSEQAKNALKVQKEYISFRTFTDIAQKTKKDEAVIKDSYDGLIKADLNTIEKWLELIWQSAVSSEVKKTLRESLDHEQFGLSAAAAAGKTAKRSGDGASEQEAARGNGMPSISYVQVVLPARIFSEADQKAVISRLEFLTNVDRLYIETWAKEGLRQGLTVDEIEVMIDKLILNKLRLSYAGLRVKEGDFFYEVVSLDNSFAHYLGRGYYSVKTGDEYNVYDSINKEMIKIGAKSHIKILLNKESRLFIAFQRDFMWNTILLSRDLSVGFQSILSNLKSYGAGDDKCPIILIVGADKKEYFLVRSEDGERFYGLYGEEMRVKDSSSLERITPGESKKRMRTFNERAFLCGCIPPIGTPYVSTGLTAPYIAEYYNKLDYDLLKQRYISNILKLTTTYNAKLISGLENNSAFAHYALAHRNIEELSAMESGNDFSALRKDYEESLREDEAVPVERAEEPEAVAEKREERMALSAEEITAKKKEWKRILFDDEEIMNEDVEEHSLYAFGSRLIEMYYERNYLSIKNDDLDMIEFLRDNLAGLQCYFQDITANKYDTAVGSFHANGYEGLKNIFGEGLTALRGTALLLEFQARYDLETVSEMLIDDIDKKIKAYFVKRFDLSNWKIKYKKPIIKKEGLGSEQTLLWIDKKEKEINITLSMRSALKIFAECLNDKQFNMLLNEIVEHEYGHLEGKSDVDMMKNATDEFKLFLEILSLVEYLSSIREIKTREEKALVYKTYVELKKNIVKLNNDESKSIMEHFPYLAAELEKVWIEYGKTISHRIEGGNSITRMEMADGMVIDEIMDDFGFIRDVVMIEPPVIKGLETSYWMELNALARRGLRVLIDGGLKMFKGAEDVVNLTYSISELVLNLNKERPIENKFKNTEQILSAV
ncbi:MAG: hypothetical protein ABH857_01310 [Elusimicrobiota bacterium]